MDKLIAYCGLDCEKCEARMATINDDDNMRQMVAEKWNILNEVTIKKEDINCLGCMVEGIKFPFCEHMCPIRLCALSKGLERCGKCTEIALCDKIKMVTDNNKEVLDRLLNDK